MDRRNFLKTSAFAGLALTAAPQLLDAKGEKVLRPDWNSELWYHKIQSIEYAETFMKYPRLEVRMPRKISMVMDLVSEWLSSRQTREQKVLHR